MGCANSLSAKYLQLVGGMRLGRIGVSWTVLGTCHLFRETPRRFAELAIPGATPFPSDRNQYYE